MTTTKLRQKHAEEKTVMEKWRRRNDDGETLPGKWQIKAQIFGDEEMVTNSR